MDNFLSTVADAGNSGPVTTEPNTLIYARFTVPANTGPAVSTAVARLIDTPLAMVRVWLLLSNIPLESVNVPFMLAGDVRVTVFVSQMI